ncbi:MAG TPA: DNA (cytosine-5-)-methyltransferase [Clostridiaceae bacterium]|nr:DNA (cytosine-5-)-methyltransferase [Clostridiaceae bacterium]
MINIKYFELFAGTGIGGIALDRLGFENVGYSEIDPSAIKNYNENFPNRKNYGDITKIKETELPDFDIIIGGSPCTDISQMKKDGEGLNGINSKLFHDYIRILNYKKPKWFIFENVRKLLTSNDGDDFKIVKESFEINYNIKYKVLNTADYGVPQTRRRIYIVGQRKDLGDFNYVFPNIIPLNLIAQDLLVPKVDDKYYLTDKMSKTVLSRGTGGWDANPETDLKIARPLCATLYKMHRASQDNYYHTEYKPKDKTNLRRPTPRECARLQGLPDTYKIVVSDTQAYKLFGNAMSYNVVSKVVEMLFDCIE